MAAGQGSGKEAECRREENNIKYAHKEKRALRIVWVGFAVFMQENQNREVHAVHLGAGMGRSGRMGGGRRAPMSMR